MDGYSRKPVPVDPTPLELHYAGYPAAIPQDPTGDEWRGPPGPQGPQGPPGPRGPDGSGRTYALYAEDYGVAASASAASNTTNLQRAINDAQAFGPNWTQTPGKLLILPAGRISFNGVTIAAPIAIQGSGRWGTVLSLASGNIVPAISIAAPASAFSSASGAGAIALRNLHITSPSRIDPPGVNIAHGLALTNPAGSQTTAVLLDDIMIENVAGDGINATSFNGWIEARNVHLAYPGRYGIFATSCFDWNWQAGEIYGGVGANVLLSGCANFRFHAANFYSAGAEDFRLFNAELTCTNCMIDLARADGIFVDNRAGYATRGVVLAACQIRWASANANATYSDLHLSAQNTASVFLSGCRFWAPSSSSSANKPLYNIAADGGNTGAVYLSNTVFDLGPPGTAGITNSPAILRNFVDGPVTVGTDAVTQTLTVNGPAGSNRQLMFDTAGSLRWGIRATTSTESGGNNGSAFALDAYSDAGTYLYSPITANRNNGYVTVARGVTLGATDNVVARAGGGQTNATQITTQITRVSTVVTAADSVKLPASFAGFPVIVINAAANPFQLFGAGTDTINGVATATGVSVPAGKTALYACVTPGAWFGGALN